MTRAVSQEDIKNIAIGAMIIDCSFLHKGSCFSNLVKNFLHGFKFGMKFYVPLYFIPLVFKYKDFVKDPAKALRNALKRCVRSTMVLATMVLLGKIVLCSYIRLFRTVDSGLMAYMSASVTLASFIETPIRISEMALYVLPRFLGALWKFLIRRGLVKNIPFGHVILFSLSTSAMMYSSKIEPENIKPFYKKAFEKFLGEN